MEKQRWPKIVGEPLAKILGLGTWADYEYELMQMYAFETSQRSGNWNLKMWGRQQHGKEIMGSEDRW